MKFNPEKEPKEKYVEVYQDFDVGTARVPFELAKDKRVRDKAVRLFILCFEESSNWAGSEPKKVRRTLQAKYAQRLGCSVVTVSRLTRELHNTGWATVKRTGRTNIIILHGTPKRRRNVHKKQA